MCMVMRNHELVDSASYPHRLPPEFDAWPIGQFGGVISYRISFIFFTETFFKLVPNPPVRSSHIFSTMGALKTLIFSSTRGKERSLDRRSKGEIPTIGLC
ncbi:hypothetical protein AYI68_g3929 [Smittium mucronatum]|uniref:Uncharacterized protein n=1 Tax=Smittium mucronatum TaxID=133383 RepID=A0A1R0GYJ9_9FUNG|nr:hypothetical protein AYI68_g3929 [Smittium mucronatum]